MDSKIISGTVRGMMAIVPYRLFTPWKDTFVMEMSEEKTGLRVALRTQQYKQRVKRTIASVRLQTASYDRLKICQPLI